jgi:hypothetical protein
MALPKLLTRAGEMAAEAGGVVVERVQHLRVPGAGGGPTTDSPVRSVQRWRVVTVFCPPEQIGTGGALPAPLAELADRIEIRVTPAPGDKGTELAARYRGTATRDDLRELRSALRRAKQLLEVGEVLRVDPVPHGKRKPTPQGAALEEAAAQSPKEGVL